MQVAARAGRFGLYVALLLVLLGMSVALAPGAGNSVDHPVGIADAEQHQVSVRGASISATPPMHDDLQDWLRLAEGALPASATTPQDTWAVCPRPTGECVLQAQLLNTEVGGHGMAVASPTPRSSRAPPLA